MWLVFYASHSRRWTGAPANAAELVFSAPPHFPHLGADAAASVGAAGVLRLLVASTRKRPPSLFSFGVVRIRDNAVATELPTSCIRWTKAEYSAISRSSRSGGTLSQSPGRS